MAAPSSVCPEESSQFQVSQADGKEGGRMRLTHLIQFNGVESRSHLGQEGFRGFAVGAIRFAEYGY